jgi:COP9 signalosome complex subunit 3
VLRKLSSRFTQLKLTIAPLHNLLTRYPPDISYLTPVHATFVQVCVYMSLVGSVFTSPVRPVSKHNTHLPHCCDPFSLLQSLKSPPPYSLTSTTTTTSSIITSEVSSSVCGRIGLLRELVRPHQRQLLVLNVVLREEFFEICVTSPAQMPSALQWDALKKYVLVQCIYRGKVATMAKFE